MKVLAWGNGSGSQWWRLEDPFKYLNRMGHQCLVTRKAIPQIYKEGLMEWADIFVLEGIVDMEGLAAIYMYQQEKGKKIIIEQDDCLEVTKDNPHYIEHRESNSFKIIRRMIEVADLVTTTNDYLAEQISKINTKVTVLPNCMDMDRWKKTKKTNLSGMIRVGWCGSVTHLEDLQMIEKPLKRILKEYPNVMLILVGDPRYRVMFKEFKNMEVMFGVDFEAWASKLNGLALDIGLGPLADTDFNRSRSPIKWMEYSINMAAGVYSPTVYGRQIERDFDGKLGLIAETEDQWYQAIKNLIDCKNLREDLATAAHTQVLRKFDLSRNAYKWERAYKALL